jgi:Spy/CpxP family protein refolding chaperone
VAFSLNRHRELCAGLLAGLFTPSWKRLTRNSLGAAAPIGQSATGDAKPAFRGAVFGKMRKGASLTPEQAGKLREETERARREVEEP